MDDYLPLMDQLNILFEAVKHPDGRPYTLNEVSEATGVSPGAISQMRTGRVTNPQISTVRALAHFFGVPLRYFETRTIDECYTLLATAAQPEVPQQPLSEIAFRALDLTPRSQRDVLTVIKWIQAAEKLREQGIDLPPLPNLEDYDDDTSTDTH